MSVEVLNFGCRLNLAEGEALRQRFAGEDDLVIVNSCAVTAEAERQARQAIRRAAKRRPDARIMVTGCAAEVSPQSFSAMPQIAGLLAKASDVPAVSGHDHARAFIEVQNGCDHECTFCVTTLARGPGRSIAPDAVIMAVQAAVARGYQEVVMTGVDLTSTQPSLGSMVARILKDVPALPRLRLSSLDSVEIDPLLEELLTGEPRVMPHVHPPLRQPRPGTAIRTARARRAGSPGAREPLDV